MANTKSVGKAPDVNSDPEAGEFDFSEMKKFYAQMRATIDKTRASMKAVLETNKGALGNLDAMIDRFSMQEKNLKAWREAYEKPVKSWHRHADEIIKLQAKAKKNPKDKAEIEKNIETLHKAAVGFEGKASTESAGIHRIFSKTDGFANKVLAVKL